MVVHKLGGRTVRYECDTCHHEWHVTDETPPPGAWTTAPSLLER